MSWNHINKPKAQKPRVVGQDRGRNKVRFNLYLPTDLFESLVDEYEKSPYPTFSRFMTSIIKEGFENAKLSKSNDTGLPQL